MRNLKIGRKLFVIFTIILVLFAFTVWASMSDLEKYGVKFKEFYDEGYSIVNVTHKIELDLESAEKSFGYATMNSDPALTQQYLKEAQASLDTVREQIQQLRESFAGDVALIDNCLEQLSKEEASRSQLISFITSDDRDAAISYYMNSYQPYLLQASEYVQQLNVSATQTAENYYAVAQRLEYTTKVFMYGFAVLSFGIAIILAVYITRSLTKPIQELELAADKMSQGDFDLDIKYTSRDELGTLATSMKTLTEHSRNIIRDMGVVLGELSRGNFTVESQERNSYIGEFAPLLSSIDIIIAELTDTLTQINRSSDSVAAGANQMADGSQALSQGSTEQASSIQELSATIAEVADQIRTNAAHAVNAKTFSEKSGEDVIESNRKMQSMIVAMTNISEKSNEISKIIKTIDDIAFQTNILALNAAVEAARAGAAGKGFAVVADEVRNLAQKSAEAAADTSRLIEESIHAVEEGTKIADLTAEAMMTVVEGTKTVTNLVEEIAVASETQASSIAQINLGVEQISGVVQTNSATAEESAATSEELSSQVQILKHLVDKFRLKSNNTSPLTWSQVEEPYTD